LPAIITISQPVTFCFAEKKSLAGCRKLRYNLLMLEPGSAFDSKEFPLPSRESAQSIEYQIDRDRRVVYVTLAGEVSIDALYAVRDAVLADEHYTRDMNLWIECRVMTSMPSEAEIRALALSVVLHHASVRVGRIAIVAMTARAYEAASHFEVFADAPADRLAIFTDPVQARIWLALP
jgi:hypothetical protein